MTEGETGDSEIILTTEEEDPGNDEAQNEATAWLDRAELAEYSNEIIK
jgi:hypothetical protein